jgi:hypothetical protein
VSEIKRLGGQQPDKPLTILDNRTRQEPVQPEIHLHEEVIAQDDKLRREQPQEGEPEVRIRHALPRVDFIRMLEGD